MRLDKLGIIEIVAGVFTFTAFYISGSIGTLSSNLSYVVDTIVIALLVGGTTTIIGPRIANRDRTEDIPTPEFKNAEARSRMEKERWKRLNEYMVTADVQKALSDFPSLRVFINGLTLMNDEGAALKRQEADAIFHLDLALLRAGGDQPTSYWEAWNAQKIAQTAIEIMTVPKDSRASR